MPPDSQKETFIPLPVHTPNEVFLSAPTAGCLLSTLCQIDKNRPDWQNGCTLDHGTEHAEILQGLAQTKDHMHCAFHLRSSLKTCGWLFTQIFFCRKQSVWGFTGNILITRWTNQTGSTKHDGVPRTSHFYLDCPVILSSSHQASRNKRTAVPPADQGWVHSKRVVGQLGHENTKPWICWRAQRKH